MKNILLNSSIIFTLCVLLATAISCRKEIFIEREIIKRDTIYIQDNPQTTNNTGAYIRTFDSVTATTASTNKVIRIDGFQATNLDAFSDCESFKFTNYFRVNRKIGNQLTINMYSSDSIVTLKSDDKNIIIDSLHYNNRYSFSFHVRTTSDTVRDPSVKFTFQTATKKIFTQSVLFVGEINTKCFGTHYWATRYFRLQDGTLDRPLSKAIDIDSTYVPKRGDIIVWEGPHYGTVYNVPTVIATTKLGKTTYQYDFNLYEQNAKCTSAITYKVEKVLSTNVLGTFFSYNLDRGEPLYYYRNL